MEKVLLCVLERSSLKTFLNICMKQVVLKYTRREMYQILKERSYIFVTISFRVRYYLHLLALLDVLSLIKKDVFNDNLLLSPREQLLRCFYYFEV